MLTALSIWVLLIAFILFLQGKHNSFLKNKSKGVTMSKPDVSWFGE